MPVSSSSLHSFIHSEQHTILKMLKSAEEAQVKDVSGQGVTTAVSENVKLSNFFCAIRPSVKWWNQELPRQSKAGSNLLMIKVSQLVLRPVINTSNIDFRLWWRFVLLHSLYMYRSNLQNSSLPFTEREVAVRLFSSLGSRPGSRRQRSLSEPGVRFRPPSRQPLPPPVAELRQSSYNPRYVRIKNTMLAKLYWLAGASCKFVLLHTYWSLSTHQCWRAEVAYPSAQCSSQRQAQTMASRHLAPQACTWPSSKHLSWSIRIWSGQGSSFSLQYSPWMARLLQQQWCCSLKNLHIGLYLYCY